MNERLKIIKKMKNVRIDLLLFCLGFFFLHEKASISGIMRTNMHDRGRINDQN